MATVSKTRTPTQPVVVSEFGEAIRGYTDDEMYEEKDLMVQVHDECRGFVDIRSVSGTHRALVCRACSLRIVIPAKIKTLGDLKKHFNQFNK